MKVRAIVAQGISTPSPADFATCLPAAPVGLAIPGLTNSIGTPVAATEERLAYCRVEGAPDGAANCSPELPDNWQQRFSVLANAACVTPSVEGKSALAKGCATVVSDTVNSGGTFNTKFVQDSLGQRDQTKVVYFFSARPTT